MRSCYKLRCSFIISEIPWLGLEHERHRPRFVGRRVAGVLQLDVVTHLASRLRCVRQNSLQTNTLNKITIFIIDSSGRRARHCSLFSLTNNSNSLS